ncbi:response regulator transcription factor [Flavobacterium sp.]|uniref:response regulator transcription factor n=1 Tax=Flavobacterium sp. TaxID=239 RepID=UPI00120DF5D0|nr:response regulator transcription factor [Flavobacterium sp.]RZJ72720.1 MAG: response regulator transcription factor [Flavobacterium sp.]
MNQSRILVVEDEKGISEFLRQGLEEEGFFVSVAADGSQGLTLARTQAFDVILLDWMLPKLSGLEVCKRLRESRNETPVLFLTAKDTVQDTVAGLKSGANDYIKKPFSFEELLERIKVQLRNGHETVDDLRLGDILVKRATHQVFRASEEIMLTQKEFALLEYLIERKGTICTRNRIIEDVWNIHFSYDTGVIDVFMNSLRKKLHLKKEEDYIKTVRGIGYIVNEIEHD